MTNLGKNLLILILGILSGIVILTISQSAFSYFIEITDDKNITTITEIETTDKFATTTFNSLLEKDTIYREDTYQTQVINKLNLILIELIKLNSK